jgi:flagellar motor switch protein FliM
MQGLVSLCLPVSLVESGRGANTPAWRRQQPAISPVERGWIHDNLGRVVVPVAPYLETRLSGRDVLALQPGDLVALGVPVTEPIDVKVGGVRKLRGRLTARDQRALVQLVGSPLSA